MADFLAPIRPALERMGLLSPAELASPEDLTAPPDQGGIFSRSPDMVLSLTGGYMKGLALNPDTVLVREGSHDLGLYDRLLDDDVAMSCLQQRRLAITSRDWEVTPGDDRDPRSVKAAEEFRAMCAELGIDRVTGLLHYGVWYGYAVAEGLYTTRQFDGRLIVWLSDIVVPDRRWFGFTLEGELRLTAALAAFAGEKVPPNKFVTIRTGGTHDFAFYGLGLAHWAYWPIFFKRAAVRHWALYLEKLSRPTVVGGFGSTDTQADKNTLLASIGSIGLDTAVLVPEELVEKIKLMETARPGSGGSGYKEFSTEHNEALMRIVLGQPGTSKATAGGIGSTQADVHADVKAEIVKADADLISDGLNTFARWLTRWNHGEDVAPPSIFRVLDDAEDMNSIAERDVKLDGLGWRRTEDSVEQIYGGGYERKPEPEPVPVALGGAPGLPIAANDDEEAAAERKRRAEFDANDPRPLYVMRRLQNVAPLRAWAKAQGFADLDDEPHVTVLFSRTPVDWFAMGESYGGLDGKLSVPEGGPRLIEKLGDKAALVFSSLDIRWRHETMVERGASHDFPQFTIHVSIADAGDRDLSTIEPYEGELIFGPEIFRELIVDPDPLAMFSADEEDQIDRLTAALMDEANPVFVEFAASIRGSIAQAKANGGGQLSLEGARVALLQAFERFDPRKLADMTGLAFVAERAAAEAGVEDQITA